VAREAGCLGGGSAALLDLIEEHKPEFAFDFRRYFGIPLRDIGTSECPYGEALLLLFELRKESGSHTHMRIHGFTETTALSQFTDMLLAQRILNYLRPENTPAIELPIPMERADPNADVTPERRAELRAQLQRRSAFAS